MKSAISNYLTGIFSRDGREADHVQQRNGDHHATRFIAGIIAAAAGCCAGEGDVEFYQFNYNLSLKALRNVILPTDITI